MAGYSAQLEACLIVFITVLCVCEADPGCSCPEVTSERVGRSRYLQKSFNYALKAVYLGTSKIEKIPNVPAVINISIKEVLKKSDVNVEIGSQTLWVQTGCVCPLMEIGKTYLFLGYEDRYNQRLLFNHNCIAVRWKKKWPDYIQKWESMLKKQNRLPKLSSMHFISPRTGRIGRKPSTRSRSDKKARRSQRKNVTKHA